MATPAIYPFMGDGSRTVFPIPTKIIGTEYVKLFLNGTAVLDQTLYDIINNSIVFKTAPVSASTITVWVASSVEELAGLGYTSNIDIVADNIADIKLIADGIDTINTVSSESQLKAWESEAEALTSASYSTQAEDVFVNAYTSDGDGTFTLTPTTDYSAYHWSQKAATFNPSLYALLTGATFTGAISGTSATFTGNISALNLTSGSYVPTLSGANVQNFSPYAAYYYRVGNMVTVSIEFYCQPISGASGSTVYIPLPITADIASTVQGAGTAVSTSGFFVGYFSPDPTANDMRFYFNTADTTTRTWKGTFTYRII